MAPPMSTGIRLGAQARVAIGAGLLLALSGTTRAAAPPSSILSEVRVTGGNPIAGIIPDGIIFRQKLDARCQPVVEQPPQPFSVPLRYPPGQVPTLHLDFTSCRSAASRLPIPPGSCELRIGDDIKLVLPNGVPAAIPLPLPKSTGLYPVSLVCPAAGPVATDLYATYARPGEPLATPPPDMYRRVLTSWGKGFQADTAETDVLAKMENRIYSHGQRKWRYGFCRMSADGSCQFGSTRIEAGSKQLATCVGELCLCDPKVVAAGDSCNFTDCFRFTAIFETAAAVQGITGFVPHQEWGANWKGFVLRPSARSIDPVFSGNLLCGDRNVPCSYMFVNHSLLRRSGLFYDTTFGRIYAGLQEMIEESAEDFVPGGPVRFPSFLACPGNRGYGQFRQYRETSLDVECMPGSPAAELTGVVSWEGARSNDGDPRREAVAVAVEVKAHKAGRFIVGGGLFSGIEPVSLTGRLDVSEAPVEAVLDMQQGEIREAILLFAGEPLVRLGTQKPVALHALLADQEGRVSRRELPLPPVPDGLLGELDEPAALFPPGAAEQARVEIVEKEDRTVLRVTAPVVIRREGRLSVNARLASGLETLAYAGHRADFSEGTREITVDFPLDESAAARSEGTYGVTLLLYKPGPEGTLSRFEDALELSIDLSHFDGVR